MEETSLADRLKLVSLGAWQYHPSVGSTNDLALAWADQGAPDMALVVADEQTAGRGRFQRHWVTNPGAALAFSLVLRPTRLEGQFPAHFAALGALAVCQVLASDYGLPAQIKWPNDVLLLRRKVCGILVENSWQGDHLQVVVIGIGVNIIPAAVPPPEQVLFPATCVEAHLGRPVDRWAVLQEILLALIAWRGHLGQPEFLSAWQTALAFRGEWVRISATQGPDREGKLLGVDNAGNLRLLEQNGVESRIEIGDVHLRLQGET